MVEVDLPFAFIEVVIIVLGRLVILVVALDQSPLVAVVHQVVVHNPYPLVAVSLQVVVHIPCLEEEVLSPFLAEHHLAYQVEGLTFHPLVATALVAD